jgi:hypothetical protein
VGVLIEGGQDPHFVALHSDQRFQALVKRSNRPIGALARWELGRAFVMSGDKKKVKTAYEEFLTLWKDADPDIPVLEQAKAEYSKA